VHIADITMFYAPTSGGVRTYLEQKQRHFASHAGIRHSVLVPGKRLERRGAFLTLPAPPLGWTGYRLPLRGARWTQELCRLQPDLIEAGDPYRLAWAALAAGQRLGVPVSVFITRICRDWSTVASAAARGDWPSVMCAIFTRAFRKSWRPAGSWHDSCTPSAWNG
jgi:hypothetical protein